jgi:glycine cleavage system H protein
MIFTTHETIASPLSLPHGGQWRGWGIGQCSPVVVGKAMNPPVCKVSYKRSRFSTRLPEDRRYTPAHYWLLEIETGLWRVGFTQFATRMLGDLVEHGYEVKPGTSLELGDLVGWIEAFKATTDLYAVVTGEFVENNTSLETDPTLFDSDPYGQGWLYLVRGTPDPNTVDAKGYTGLLDLAIDKILGKNPELAH